MGRNDDFDILTAKYNRLCARYRDLEKQAEERQTKSEEIERELRVRESLARELCELILAKDSSEMRLGKEYSWRSLATRDIIERSKTVFAEYNRSRTELLLQIQGIAEERRLEIERLQKVRENEEKRLDDDANSKSDDSPAKKENPSPSKTKHSDSKDENGAEYLRENEEQNGYGNLFQSVTVTEETKDRSKADAEQQKFPSIKNAKNKLKNKNPSSKPENPENLEALKQKAKEFSDKLTDDRAIYLLQTIGETGACTQNDMIGRAIKKVPKAERNEAAKVAFRSAMKRFESSGIIQIHETISVPIGGQMNVYQLNEIGKLVYCEKFGKEPVDPEYEQWERDHDNLEHALGILQIRKLLLDTRQYYEVLQDRKSNTIRLDNGTSYIPDLIAKKKLASGDEISLYFEYERGTHNKADFFTKMNKAAEATQRLYIVVQNLNTMEHVAEQLTEWGKRRKNPFPFVVFLATVKDLDKKKNVEEKENWRLEFAFRYQAEPFPPAEFYAVRERSQKK